MFGLNYWGFPSVQQLSTAVTLNYPPPPKKGKSVGVCRWVCACARSFLIHPLLPPQRPNRLKGLNCSNSLQDEHRVKSEIHGMNCAAYTYRLPSFREFSTLFLRCYQHPLNYIKLGSLLPAQCQLSLFLPRCCCCCCNKRVHFQLCGKVSICAWPVTSTLGLS